MSNSNLDKRKPLDKKGGLLAILIAILWSANPLAAKIGLEDAPIFRLGFMRFALGIFVVVAWGIYTKQSFLISKKTLIPLGISSVIVPIQFDRVQDLPCLPYNDSNFSFMGCNVLSFL